MRDTGKRERQYRALFEGKSNPATFTAPGLRWLSTFSSELAALCGQEIRRHHLTVATRQQKRSEPWEHTDGAAQQSCILLKTKLAALQKDTARVGETSQTRAGSRLWLSRPQNTAHKVVQFQSERTSDGVFESMPHSQKVWLLLTQQALVWDLFIFDFSFCHCKWWRRRHVRDVALAADL